MFGYILSVPGRLKAFVGRNKFRLAGAAALAGGVWYYYGNTIKQGLEIYRLVQQAQQQGDDEEPVSSSPSAAHDPSYRQTVSTGDETSQKQFQSIRIHLAELYSGEMESIQAELKLAAPSSASSREQLFAQLHLLCYSRLVTALFLVHTLLLLARVEVCLVGRANKRIVDDETKADHRELLSALRSVTSRDTVGKIDAVARRLVEAGFAEVNLGPTSIVQADRIEPFLRAICDGMVAELHVGTTSSWDWLLGRLCADGSASQSIICRETLDVLESPQFSAVLTFLLKRAVGKALTRSVPEGKDAQSFPAALLMPGIRLEPELATTANGIYVALFKEAPVVDEFCESVYHAADSYDCPGDDERAQNLALLEQLSGGSPSNSHDPNMAKLGELLERLVKADMSK